MNLLSPTPQATADAAPREAAPKLWQVGTLVYTRAGLTVLFAWLLWGDFAWSIRDRVLLPVLQLILKKYEVYDFIAGLLIGTLPAILGVLVGPVVSFKSDRHRSSRGRRIPYLLASAPAAGLAIIGLGFSPVLGRWLHQGLGTSSPGLNASVVVVLAFWWMIYDVASTVTNCIFGALINDVVPSSVVGRFYGYFRAVSLVVGIIFTTWFLAKAEDHFLGLFLFAGIVFGVGVVFMCLKVKEGDYPPLVHAQGKRGLAGVIQSIKVFFKQGFSIPYYVWFFLASSLGLLAFIPFNLYTVFYAKSLGLSMSTYGMYTSVSYGFSLCLTFFLGPLADRFHPLRLSLVTLALYGATTLWAFFFVSAASFGVIMMILSVLAGAYYTGAASLYQRILPSSIFAELGSAGGIIGTVLNVSAPLIIGSLLDRSGHNYRLTFIMGFVVTLMAIGCMSMVYWHWKKYGGPQNYKAPLWEAE